MNVRDPGNSLRLFMGLLLATLVLSGMTVIGTADVASAATTSVTANQNSTQSMGDSYKPATQAVGVTLPGGPGHPGPVFAGTWKNGKKNGFCPDFALPAPNGNGTKKLTGKILGLNTEDSATVKFLVNLHSQTDSEQVAKHAALLIWDLIDSPEYRKWSKWARKNNVITAKDDDAMKAMSKDAQQRAPYTMKVSLDPVLVGQQGKGAVTLLGSNGQPAIGRSVKLKASGGKVLKVNGNNGTQGVTKSSGLPFVYEHTQTGPANVEATFEAPSTDAVDISLTQKGHQRTLTGGYFESVVASAGADKTADISTVSACDTPCTGVAKVSVPYCNPNGAQAIKITRKVGGTVVNVLSLAGGDCGTKVFTLNDGKFIDTEYCYTGKKVGGKCTSKTVKLPGSYEVVCPAWVNYIFQLSGGCNTNSPATITFLDPAGSPRFYVGGLDTISNGKTTPSRLSLVDGKEDKITTPPLTPGSEVVISFAAFKDVQHIVPLGDTHVLRRITVDAPDRAACPAA